MIIRSGTHDEYPKTFNQVRCTLIKCVITRYKIISPSSIEWCYVGLEVSSLFAVPTGKDYQSNEWLDK